MIWQDNRLLWLYLERKSWHGEHGIDFDSLLPLNSGLFSFAVEDSKRWASNPCNNDTVVWGGSLQGWGKLTSAWVQCSVRTTSKQLKSNPLSTCQTKKKVFKCVLFAIKISKLRKRRGRGRGKYILRQEMSTCSSKSYAIMQQQQKRKH